MLDYKALDAERDACSFIVCVAQRGAEVCVPVAEHLCEFFEQVFREGGGPGCGADCGVEVHAEGGAGFVGGEERGEDVLGDEGGFVGIVGIVGLVGGDEGGFFGGEGGGGGGGLGAGEAGEDGMELGEGHG